MMIRVAARLKGEVKADTLESFRRAGGIAYEELHHAEALRRRLAAEGAHPWRVEPGVSGRLLCAWNAFVLQAIGEHLLDADYAADPRTPGYVPPVTHTQVAACFDPVEHWTSLARQAACDDGFEFDASLRLPADLPEWVETDPCPFPYLRGLQAATRTVRGYAEVALGELEAAVQDEDPAVRDDLRVLRRLAAKAATAADYAEGLLGDAPQDGPHEEIEQRLQRSLETYHHLGQLVAMPALISDYETGELDLAAVGAEGPAVSAFDPWFLTSPRDREHWQADPRARRAIEELWAGDPEPRIIRDVQRQIDAARRAGAVSHARGADGELLGGFHVCPWAAVYEVHREIDVHGRRLRPGQQFTVDVHLNRGTFVRKILVGTFTATTRVDYAKER